jgi:hypothetical protein
MKVSPMRGTRRFKVKGKLAPRYVFPNSGSQGRSGLSTWATATAIRYTRRVLCVPAQEVFTSSRRADTDGTTWSRRRSIIQREANQNFGYCRMSDSQQGHQDVQSAVESPDQRRSYLGAWRRTPSRLCKAFSQRFQISRMRFLLRGVGL